MVLVVAPFTVLVLVLVVVLLLAPAAIDLVNRSDGLTAWWSVPFLLVPLPVLGLLLLPFGERAAIDRSTMAAASMGFAHLSLAAFFAILGLGLAASRGLRPGGPTQRRKRTSLVALIFLMMPLFLPMVSLSLFWMMTAFLVGVLWVVALNRRGPSRLERGKALSAGMLVAAAIQAGWVLVHGAWFTDLEGYTHDLVVGAFELVPAAVVLVVLVAGLRVLAGSVHPLFPVLSLGSGVSLVVPIAMWGARGPLPEHPVLAEWVDLEAEPGPYIGRVRYPECFWRLSEPHHESYPCRFFTYALVAADAPLTVLPDESRIVVGDGERAAQRSYTRWGPDLVVREVQGRAQVDGVQGTFAVGPELHAVLSADANAGRPLLVHASPVWSVQQYVSMCASTGANPECTVRSR